MMLTPFHLWPWVFSPNPLRGYPRFPLPGPHNTLCLTLLPAPTGSPPLAPPPPPPLTLPSIHLSTTWNGHFAHLCPSETGLQLTYPVASCPPVRLTCASLLTGPVSWCQAGMRPAPLGPPQHLFPCTDSNRNRCCPLVTCSPPSSPLLDSYSPGARSEPD